MPTEVNYRGNALLKRVGVPIEWTPELLEEYARCENDVLYFCKKYMRIVHVDDGVVPFEMYDYQKQMTKSMTDNRYSIFACARQSGKSTAVCGFVLHYILFNSEKNVAILANKEKTATEILARIQKAYFLLPQWLQQGIIKWQTGSCELENGSRVFAGSTSNDSIRGYSINCLILDEAAFIKNFDEFYTSTFPTISSGKTTKVILVSTPCGLNHFYKFWNDANRDKDDPDYNGFNPIRVVWQDVPGRDPNTPEGKIWYEQTMGGLGNDAERFSQEYEVSFLGSSNTLISGKYLKELSHKTPLSSVDGLNIYQQPVRGHQYTITCDVSRGKGLDYSSFSVIDVTSMPYQQVCTYRNNLIPPVEYADIILRMGKFYNHAIALVELNDLGQQTVDTLWELEYENILYTENGGRNGKRISLKSENKADRGIRTTTTTKATGCAILKLLIEQHQLVINDWHTIQELSRFSRKNNSYEAEPGAHDDLVMGLVLFAWLSDQQYFRELTDINTISKLRERSEEEMENQLSPFAILTTGHEDISEENTDVGYDEFEKWLRE